MTLIQEFFRTISRYCKRMSETNKLYDGIYKDTDTRRDFDLNAIRAEARHDLYDCLDRMKAHCNDKDVRAIISTLHELCKQITSNKGIDGADIVYLYSLASSDFRQKVDSANKT